MAAELIAEMEFERETKNTVRFQETNASDAGGAIGTIYVNKYAVRNALQLSDLDDALIEVIVRVKS